MQKIETTELVNKFLGTISAGLVLPKKSVPPEISKILSPYVKASNQYEEYKRIINHMRRIGLISQEKLKDGNIYLLLTAKGKKRLLIQNIDAIEIPKPKNWDGKWRVLSFDIPRDMRSRRYEFLRQLHRLGFEKVLQSMWVYPYPCEKELKKITQGLGLGEDIFYMEAKFDSENHEHLRKHFAYLLN